MKEVALRNPVRPVPEYLPAQYSGQDPGLGEDHVAEAELREYWRILWKYKALVGSLIAAGGVLALLFAFTVTPRYTAESTIRISTYEPVLSATKIEDMLQEKSRETNYLETQIQEIKSYSLADKVLSDPAVKQALERTKLQGQGFFTRLFGSDKVEPQSDASIVDGIAGYNNPISGIKSYLESISVKPVRRTSLVGISAVSQDRETAAVLANKHALSYIDWVREKRMEQQSRGLKFLVTQSEELREKVADLEREMAEYAENNSIVALNKDENITVQKMSQLNTMLTQATAKRIEYENTYHEAESALSKSSAGYDDQSTQVTRSEMARLEAEYEQLSQKFTDSYPRMMQIKSQLQRLRDSIAGQREQIVAGLKSKYLAALEEEKKLTEELEQQKSQTFELSKREVQYNVLNRELSTSRELLENVLKQIKETSLAVENNASNVTIVDFAAVPKSPSFPRKKLILLLGLLVGAVIGVVLCFLLNYLDNTVRTPEDVTRLLNVPALGVVPSFAADDDLNEAAGGAQQLLNAPHAGAPGDSKAEAAHETDPNLPIKTGAPAAPVMFVANPRSLASEAYRTIRTGILLSQAGEPPRTILVSSAQSSEGKTTSSVNLAASLVSAGGKVILIDADLRRPSVYTHFGLQENLPGLVEVLTGMASIDEVVIKDLIKGLVVIPSGRIPPNPAELLGSTQMIDLLDKLGGLFDYIIIDSPPILPVTDSVVLSRVVDGVVLVVKGASTPRRVARDARDRLKGVGARLLGVILNDVDVQGGDYYYYNRYYHAYYREDGTKVKRAKAVGE